MNIFAIGGFMLVVGLGLLPFGVGYFKKSWDEYKDLPSDKKKAIIFFEILDVFSFSPILSTWLLFISVLLIIGGIALIFYT